MLTLASHLLPTLLDNAPTGVFVHDAAGRILDVNARSCADLNYTREELQALTVHDIAHGTPPSAHTALWAHALPGATITLRQSARRKDGTTFPAEITLTCQHVEGQKLFMGFARDISEEEATTARLRSLQDQLEHQIRLRTTELRETRDQLQGVMDSAHDAIAFQDRGGRFQILNRAAQAWLGRSQAEVEGKTALEVFGPQLGARMQEAETQVLTTGEPCSVEERVPVHGHERVILVTRSVHRGPSGDVAGLVSIARDMTELRRRELEIRQEHGRLTMATRVAGLGIWDFNLAQDTLSCDAQWYRIMGREGAPPVRTLADFRAFIHPDDVERATEVDMTVAQLVNNGELYGNEFRIVRPDGAVRWVRSAACLIDDLHGAPYRAVGFVVDVTESRLADEQLQRHNQVLMQQTAALSQRSEELARSALEDALTGIANRRRLDQALTRDRLLSAHLPRPIALAMIDIDFFKHYNDHYGHLQGDAALKAVAQVLSSLVRRPHDLVARYGGEEFALLLPGDTHPELVLHAIAEALARLQIPHAASPLGPYLTISCGCVVATALDGLSGHDLLAHSDQALYRAKEAGRNRIVLTRL